MILGMTVPPRILIADDAADLRLLLRNVLELEGFEVAGEAGDGQEAITLVSRLRPDAILLDLRMPQMTGTQAIPGIKRASPKTKIVILSGNSDEEISKEGLGVDGVILKGTGLKEIVQVLNTLLDRG